MSFEVSNSTNKNPNQQLGFELKPIGDVQPGRNPDSFIPEFYPEDFTQVKKKELNRYGGGCSGESVSIKTVKNREFHVVGKILFSKISYWQSLMDYEGRIDLISPLTPNGGINCYIKSGELGNQKGFDPMTNQRIFKYTLDLVATARDETDKGQNSIISAIVDSGSSGSSSCTYDGNPRTDYKYTGDAKELFSKWQNCKVSTDEFIKQTAPGDGINKLELK